MDPIRHPGHSNSPSARSTSAAGREAYAECRGIAMRQLAAVLAEVLDRADDALFDFVQKSHSNDEQKEFFDAMRELRRRRSAIEIRFRDHLNDAFAALEMRQPLFGTVAQQVERERSGLSLVGADELEEQLAAEQVALTVDRRHAEALRRLDLRLAALVGLPGIEASANPCGPVHVSLGFRAGLDGIEVPIQARVVLYKMLERQLLDGAGAMLAEIHQKLSQLGVPMPPRPGESDIVREIVRDRAETASLYVPQHNHEAMRATGITQSGSQHPAESVDDIFSAVRDLCHAVLEAQRAVARTSSAPRIFLGERQALGALHVLQRDVPEALLRAVDDPQASLSVLLRQELLNKAEQMHMGGAGTGLVEHDEEALFLVGMLFDVLLAQRSYQRPVKQNFVRLTVPYARAALLDQQLFASKTHPARQLLNSLAEACDGNHGESASERDLLGRVGNVVDRLAAEFNEDVAIFAELEGEFRGFLEQHRKRVELAERRATEAQRGRERLDEARIMASMELASLLGAREVPPVIDAVLARYWTHHLAVVFLREGLTSPRYIEARRTGENLWRAFLDCENGADLPEGFRERLLPVLASSGLSGPAANEVLDAVEWVMQSVRLGRLDAAHAHPLPPAMQQAIAASIQHEPVTEATAVAAPSATAATAAAEPTLTADAEPAEGAPRLQVVGGTDTLDFDRADVDRLRELALGAWVEFIDEAGEAQPAKLSWISPISSRLLFVNRRGMRQCAASTEELAAMMKQGRLRLREADSAFERAMSNVLGKLREAMPGNAAG